jgi:hypothetical protein
MYGPMMPGWEQWWPWMIGMHIGWMLLPLIAVVLAVIAIVIAMRGPQTPITPKS